MADLGKPTAHSYAASQTAETGMSPLHFGDKCFLCGREVGETDPRQFYQGKSAMMLCHTGCLNVMNTHGGTPADYHRAKTSDSPPGRSAGPSWLDFPDLASLQRHGPIPGHVKVTVAGAVVQEGQ